MKPQYQDEDANGDEEEDKKVEDKEVDEDNDKSINWFIWVTGSTG